jgi:hypothetical protein
MEMMQFESTADPRGIHTAGSQLLCREADHECDNVPLVIFLPFGKSHEPPPLRYGRELLRGVDMNSVSSLAGQQYRKIPI